MFDNLRNRLNFDDLLFEKRNRDYGAYQLRKRYNSVIVTGIFLATCIVVLLVLLPFFSNRGNDRVLRGGLNYVSVNMENLEPPIDPIIIPPAPPPPEETHIQEVVQYIPPVVVDTLLPLEPTQATADDILAHSENDRTNASATGSGDDLLSGLDGSETGEAFFVVEVMPLFKGGDLSKFREWVGKRTNYPQAAYERKIRGTVFLTFIVEKDGSVSNVTVVKGVDPLLDNEAIKAISESPKWTPGLQRGQPVRVRFSIPLNFMF
jgi:periplasmic protein TonB